MLFQAPTNGQSRISLSKQDTDPLDENDWQHQHEWLTARLERFNQVFRSRIMAFNAEDWIPENDDE